MYRVFILAITLSFTLADWPQFLQNGKHSSYSLPSKENNTLWCTPDYTWKHPDGANTYNAIVGRNVVFTTGTSGLTAFDIHSGEQLWHTKLNIKTAAPSVPSFSDKTNLVYTMTDNSVFYAINATSGEIKWTYEFEQFISFVAPYTILFDDKIVVSNSKVFGTPGYLTAFVDSEDMEISWNITFASSVLEMNVNENGYLFAIVGETLQRFNLFAINITNGEHIWKNSTVINSTVLFDFVAMYNGNLIVNTGNSFSVVESTTGSILMKKENYVVRATTPDSIYALRVDEMFGFQAKSQFIVKMDYDFNVTSEFNIGFLAYGIRLAVDGDNMLYFTGQNGTLAYISGYDIESTDILWRIFESDSQDLPVTHLFLAIGGEGHVIWTMSWQQMRSLASCGNRGTCDTDTRVCECNAKWEGSDCSECKNDCSDHGSCNDLGDCVCYNHWQGSNCTTCPEFWTGDECNLCDKDCGHGTCNSDDGTCVCEGSWHTKYHGDDCKESQVTGSLITIIVIGIIIVVTAVSFAIWKLKNRQRASYESL